MFMLQSFVAFALITLSTAIPVELEKRAFTITQVERRNPSNGSIVRSNGPDALAYALAKYGAPAHHIELAKRGALAASGAVAAIAPTYADVEYDCQVTIGGKKFILNLDTGSSDTWVLGPNAGAAGSHNIYTPGSTATVQDGSTWKIGYGDGSSASGSVYLDTLKFGATIVTGQAIEVASVASRAFTDADRPADGLLGLAFDNLNTIRPKQYPTFFTNAINQGLPKALFTARLKKGQPGSYSFGAIRSNEYIGAITYTTVDNSRGFWTFTPSSFAIGSGSYQAAPSGSTLKGIADTGTTLLLLDNAIVSAYYAKVRTATFSSTYNGWVFPCSATLPNLTFMINAYRAVVPGNYFNYARVDSQNCFGGLQSNAGIGFNIYGDIFLKSQFVVFDKTQAKPRLGFAIAR